MPRRRQLSHHRRPNSLPGDASCWRGKPRAPPLPPFKSKKDPGRQPGSGCFVLGKPNRNRTQILKAKWPAALLLPCNGRRCAASAASQRQPSRMAPAMLSTPPCSPKALLAKLAKLPRCGWPLHWGAASCCTRPYQPSPWNPQSWVSGS